MRRESERCKIFEVRLCLAYMVVKELVLTLPLEKRAWASWFSRALGRGVGDAADAISKMSDRRSAKFDA